MKIAAKEILSQTVDTSVVKIEVIAPEIAKKALAGQFVVLMVDKKGERIPLTIVDKDIDKGVVTHINRFTPFLVLIRMHFGIFDHLIDFAFVETT